MAKRPHLARQHSQGSSSSYEPLELVSTVLLAEVSEASNGPRVISRAAKQPISSVLQVSVGDGARMKRIVELAELAPGTEQLRYVGVDGFESAQDGGVHLTLKQAHQQGGCAGSSSQPNSRRSEISHATRGPQDWSK